MNLQDKDELQQALLELHYDLVDEREARVLREAIANDPQVAALWADTQRLADDFAGAAKLDAKLDGKPIGKLSPPQDWQGQAGSEPSAKARTDAKSHGIADAAIQSQPPGETLPGETLPGETPRGEQPVNRLADDRPREVAWWIRPSLTAVCAATLGMLVIGSWYASRLPQPPRGVIRLQATSADPHASSHNAFQIRTTRMETRAHSEDPFPVTRASLSFSVLARNTVLYSGETGTDGEGTGRIALPPSLIIPKDATLQVTARSDETSLADSTIEVPLEPTRCLTYLVVDRPVYRPGESVLFRSLTLQRRGLRVNSDVPIRFELLDPSGSPVPDAFTEGVTRRGVGNGSFTIPSNAASGPYTLVAKSLDGFFPEERCRLEVRAYRIPRIKKKLEFRRRSYGPGQRVQADFSASLAEGGSLSGASVLVTVTVDDQVIARQSMKTSAAGTCLISFPLPDLMEVGKGQLTVSVDDGVNRETVAKTIPIQSGRVKIDFYPEGGYLVEGLRNRVYFSAHDTLGKPIDIAGEILDEQGESIATVTTQRDGMGRFTMVPWHGQRYSLKITQPVDVIENPALPSVVKDLPIIDTGRGVYEPRQPLDLVIRSNKERSIVVRAVCRGRLVGERTMEITDLETPLSVPLADDAGGVIRLTVYDTDVTPAKPLVERLVYRRLNQRLKIEVTHDDPDTVHLPGQPLRLTVQVRDEKGDPAAAVLGVSVVDDASLSLDQNERPSLRTHFLLTSEIEKPQDLEHADFYLSDEPDQSEALDLLLGTQGWRRFVGSTTPQPDVSFRQQLIRLLELDGVTPSEPGQFDNANRYATVLQSYRQRIGQAWQRFVDQAFAWMFIVLLVWLVTLLIHFKRRRRPKIAAWLLVATASMALHGCGVEQRSVIDASVSPQARSVGDRAGRSGDENTGSDTLSNESPLQSPRKPDPAVSGGANAGTNRPIVDATGGANSVALTAEAGDDIAARLQQYTSSILPSGSQRISKPQLERLLTARGLDAETRADQLLNELRFPIRQYAHRYERSDEARQDFAETLYWHPLLITDSSGRATIRFDLSDSVTTFRVKVDGHTADGRLGSGEGTIISRQSY